MESDKLICPICYDNYEMTERVPMLGVCGHSVCKICCYQLKHLSEETRCPSCFYVKAFEDPAPNHTAIEILGFLDHAEKEMKALNETKEYFTTQKNSSEEYSNCSIIMKNIPRSWTLDNIRSHFYSYGMIKELNFILSGNIQNMNHGMAKVVYSSPQEADQAIKEMHRRIINGIPINVSLYTLDVREKNTKKFQGFERAQALAKVAAVRKEKTKRNNDLTVEISNLPPVSEMALREVFRLDGSIQHINIFKDRFGNQRGIARIRFDNSRGVENALQRSFQHIFGPSRPKVVVERVTNHSTRL